MRVVLMPRVRLARPDDLYALPSIERSAATLFRDAGLAWIADGDTMDAALLAAACRNQTLWVAVNDEDEPVGFLAAHPLDESFHIAELSVARPHQNRGMGAALIAAVVEHASRKGFCAVTLTTYRDLSWNGPFYSKQGFAEIDAATAGDGHVRKVRAEMEAGHDASRRCVMMNIL